MKKFLVSLIKFLVNSDNNPSLYLVIWVHHIKCLRKMLSNLVVNIKKNELFLYLMITANEMYHP